MGLTNDYDSLNPLVGVEVPDYEVWNLQYATLTDKAADDFATIPGLAESWTASDDGKTVTYTLREGLDVVGRDAAHRRGHRLHRQPGARRGVAQLRRRPSRTSPPRRSTSARSRSRPRCPTRSSRRWTSTSSRSTSGGSSDEQAITKADGTDGVGSGPFTLVEAKRGQFWRLAANPSLLGLGGRGPADRRGRLPAVLERRRDGRGARERARSTPPTTIPSESFERLVDDRGDRRARGRAGRLRRDLRQRRSSGGQARRGDRQRSPGAARTSSSARRSRTRSTSRR